MSTVWTSKDLLSGACDLDDVGREKAPLAAPAPEPFHVEDVPAKRLRRDVMKVYHQLGGHTYLHQMATSDPAQFNKLLMKVLPQTIEADVRAEVASKDIENLPTSVLRQMLLDQIEARTIDVTPERAPDSTT